jgi:hypothetical protein
MKEKPTTFIIQTKDKLPAFDFGYATIKSVQYCNWLDDATTYRYKLSSNKLIPRIDRVPVGSVQFVHDYMRALNLNPPSPLNVPEALIPFCIQYDPGRTQDAYIKSTDEIKHHKNGHVATVPDGLWQVYRPLDNIISEWRCFVWNNRLIDIKNYSGDVFVLPKKDFVLWCIDAMPFGSFELPAYTLDVAVTSEGDTVIEVHHMYSCGFYGFEGKGPAMMQAAWWKWFVRMACF